MRNTEDRWSYGLFIPHDARAAAVVRATIRSILKATRLDCIADTTELLVSELITNAYRYSLTDAYVSVDRTPEHVRVAVWDTGPGTPGPVAAGAENEQGRGLSLVAACADDWGVDDYADLAEGVTGKAV
ncbi:ATP-binding protein [Streptomyces sp. NPDC001339]|uniref:ATP-binding protein n=1 Tax=Streptomyces sp. NPDC001339 TaxID=3364563 RepID=UPI0036890305